MPCLPQLKRSERSLIWSGPKKCNATGPNGMLQVTSTHATVDTIYSHGSIKVNNLTHSKSST